MQLQIKKEKEEVASNLSQSMSEAQDLRGQIDRLEDELSEAKDNLVRAQKVQPVEVPVEPQVNEEEKQDFKETLVTWTKSNTTLVFPLSVLIAKDAISLQNNTGQVRIPVKVGQTVKALRFYPNSNKYLVVAQENSDKFLATVTLDNTNFFKQVAQLYKKRQEFLGKDYSNLPSLEEGPNGNKILNNSPKPNVTPQILSTSITDGNGKNIIRGVAQNPQLSENVLDTVSPKEAKGETVDTSDHGTNCVCKDCRAKKIGKGSLFPDL